jgi:putative oxidoreductase
MKRLLAAPAVSTPASLGLLVLRVVCGLAFMHHGWSKIQHPFDWMGPEAGMPAFLQLLAAVSEFGGGLGWILGLLTPLASFGIGCTMIVATWTVAVKLGSPFVATAQGQTSYELSLVFLCVALLLLLAGPGSFSADRVVFGQRGQSPA